MFRGLSDVNCCVVNVLMVFVFFLLLSDQTGFGFVKFSTSSSSLSGLTAAVVRPLLVGGCYRESSVCLLYILSCSPTFIPLADCWNCARADRGPWAPQGVKMTPTVTLTHQTQL